MSEGSNGLQESQNSTTSSSPRSPMQRKYILRRLLTQIEELPSGTDAVKNLETIMEEVDIINKEATIEDKASSQNQIVLDSEVVAASSVALNKLSISLTKDLNPYNVQSFTEKLLRYVHMLPDMTVDRPNWMMLENEVCKLFKTTADFSTLSGCLDPLEKKVVVKRQRTLARDPLAKTKKPEAIIEIDGDSNSVEQTVGKIKRLIFRFYKEDKKPIDFFRLILHPDDFGKTIENLLHVSFLVRDGVIQCMLDENEILVITPASKEMRSQKETSENKQNVQNIITLSFQQWQDLLEVYEITEPMLKLE